MPISNPLLIAGIGAIDLSPLEARLTMLEAENVELFAAVAALQAQGPSTTTTTTGESEMQNWQTRTAAYEMQNRDRVIADVSASAFALKLPVRARYGDECEILIDGGNTLTLDPNGSKIEGASTSFTATGDKTKLHLIYKDDLSGWIVGAGVSTNSSDDGGDGGDGGETPPTGTVAAGTVEYTATQSGLAFGNAASQATYQNLNDGNGETGAATGDGGWIQATFPDAVKVTAITLGGGYLGYFGEVSLRPYDVKYSVDEITWESVLTTSEVASSGVNQFKKFTLPTPVVAKFWRLYSPGNYLAVTEFKFE